jgi:hypothetical protein
MLYNSLCVVFKTMHVVGLKVIDILACLRLIPQDFFLCLLLSKQKVIDILARLRLIPQDFFLCLLLSKHGSLPFCKEFSVDILFPVSVVQVRAEHRHMVSIYTATGSTQRKSPLSLSDTPELTRSN